MQLNELLEYSLKCLVMDHNNGCNTNIYDTLKGLDNPSLIPTVSGYHRYTASPWLPLEITSH